MKDENYMLLPLKKYADFTGRSRRKEYWMFSLFTFLVAMVLTIIPMMAMGLSESGSLFTLGMTPLWIFALALIIPSLAVTVRRLHDTNRSGWWYLITFVPLGGIVLLVFMCLDSEPGSNKWGPNPKEPQEMEIADHLVS